MICKRKTIFELITMACTFACSFAFLQNKAIKFARGGDTIHTITIGYGYNYLPETSGETTLVNEVGTEINCFVLTYERDFEFFYTENYVSIGNSSVNADFSYHIIFYINGIVSFDLNSSYDDVAYMAMYRGDQLYKSELDGEIHVKDEEALSTIIDLSINVPHLNTFEFQSMVIKYSESSCRELSKN